MKKDKYCLFEIFFIDIREKLKTNKRKVVQSILNFIISIIVLWIICYGYVLLFQDFIR